MPAFYAVRARCSGQARAAARLPAGANLGKLEAQIAIAELARRYPNLALAPDQEFTFHPNISFRGPQVLQVRTD